MGTFSRRIGTAIVTVVATALVALAPLPAGAAEGRVAPPGKAARSDDALAEDLVERFLDLLVGEPDIERLREFLSPAFLRQGADGTSATKAEYLASTPAVLDAYEIRDLEATRRGPVLVARYDVVTEETLGGIPAKTDPAPRLSVFVKGSRGWQIIAHSNFNAPAPEPGA